MEKVKHHVYSIYSFMTNDDLPDDYKWTTWEHLWDFYPQTGEFHRGSWHSEYRIFTITPISTTQLTHMLEKIKIALQKTSPAYTLLFPNLYY